MIGLTQSMINKSYFDSLVITALLSSLLKLNSGLYLGT